MARLVRGAVLVTVLCTMPAVLGQVPELEGRVVPASLAHESTERQVPDQPVSMTKLGNATKAAGLQPKGGMFCCYNLFGACTNKPCKFDHARPKELDLKCLLVKPSEWPANPAARLLGDKA